MRHAPHAPVSPAWLVAVLCGLAATPVAAQVVLDGSLGRPGAVAGPNYAISADLGRQVGGNLFHSFAAFSLRPSEVATFSGPGSVTNLISRVTGGSASSIDGRIASAIPGANFYFLNPAGIVFGANASLDVSGSAHFATGNHLTLADNGVFNAGNPAASSLTAAEPAAFGFLGRANAIEVNGAALAIGAGQVLSLSGGDISLHGASLTSQGGSIALLAQASGGVSLSDSRIGTSGAGATPPGAISIVGGRIVLDRSRVSSSNASGAPAGLIYVSSGGGLWLERSTIESSTSGSGEGGGISISAGDVDLANGSRIVSQTEGVASGGNVYLAPVGSLFAYGETAAGESSGIAADTYGSGAAGMVSVNAQAIGLWDGAQIGSNSFGTSAGAGAGGFLSLRAAGEIRFSGVGGAGLPSGVVSLSFGPGAAGWANLQANSLALVDGGVISTRTFGQMPGAGEGGGIYVVAADRVMISGVNANGRTSGIYADSNGAGKAGFIYAQAPAIGLLDGGVVSSNAFGGGPDAGAGGLVKLVASSFLLIDGIGTNGFSSGIFTHTTGRGNAGYINVVGGNVYLNGGGQIGSTSFSTSAGAGNGGLIQMTVADSLAVVGTHTQGVKSGIVASTKGTGSAGYIMVDVGQLELSGGGQIESTTFGTMAGAGEGGLVSVKAGGMSVSGVGENGDRGASGVITESYGPGAAGSILLELGELDVRAGGQISSTSFGEMMSAGGGGFIDAKVSGSMRISGSGATGYSSGMFSDTYGPGNAGYLQIKARQLDISDGAQLISASRGMMAGAGDGGYIGIEVSDQVTLSGAGANGQLSGLFATTQGSGLAGYITLSAKDLTLLGGAQISSASFGTLSGAGGDGFVTIDVAEHTLISGAGLNRYPSALIAETYGPGKGGYIELATGSLTMADGGTISSGTFATAAGAGAGGSIGVFVNGDIAVSGVHAGSGRVSKIVSDSNGPGAAGRIVVEGRNIDLVDGGYISSSSSAFAGTGGDWGMVRVNAAESLRVSGVSSNGNRSGIYSNTEGSAYAGRIFIDSPRLEISEGGLISSSALGEMADARGEGRVDIRSNSVLISGAGSDGLASGVYTESWGPGRAGNISLSARSDQFWQEPVSAGSGYLSVQLRGGGRISSATRGDMPGAGDGGSISVSATQVELSGAGGDGAPTRISAESTGPGSAGSIEIRADNALILSGGAQIATRADRADGGNIEIRVGELVRLGDSSITTSVGSGFGNGGNILIDPRFVVLDNSLIQANAYGGDGGNIRIVTDHLISSLDSRIEASSQLGVAGSIEVTSPNVDVGSGLTVLPGQFLDASLLLRDSCAGRDGRGVSSSFLGVGNGGLPQAPEGLFTSRYDELLRLAETRPHPAGSAAMGDAAPRLLAMLDRPCGARP